MTTFLISKKMKDELQLQFFLDKESDVKHQERNLIWGNNFNFSWF